MKQTKETQTERLQLSALKAIFASFLALDFERAPIRLMLPVHNERICLSFVNWLEAHNRTEYDITISYDVVNGMMHLSVDNGYGFLSYFRT